MKRPLLHIPAFVIAVLALVGVAVASCSGEHKYNRTLLHADSIMEENPDSALALLKAVRTADLRNAADSALYGLLLTQASVKIDAEFPPDTLIGRALAFYRDADDSDRLMRSLFYDAHVHSGNTDLRDSCTTEAIEAYRIAKADADPYWTAKCAELLGDLNESSFNNEEAYRLYKEASEQYAKAGKRVNSLYSAADMELALSTMNATADIPANLSSIARLDSISRIAADSIHDMALLFNAQQLKAWIALRIQDTYIAERTLDYMDSIGLWEHAPDKSERILYQANLAVQNRDPLLAGNLMAELDSCRTPVGNPLMSNFICAAIAKQTGDYKAGMDYLYKSVDELRSTTHKALKQSAVAAHKDYLAELEEAESVHNRELRRMNAVIIAVSNIVVALLVILYIVSMKFKRLQQRKAEEEFMALHDDFERLKADLETASKQNQVEIGALCDIALKSKSENGKSHIVKDVQALIDKYKDSGYRAAAENKVERLYGPIMKKIREHCGFLSAKEQDLLLHLLAGFNTVTVAVLLDISTSNVYTQKNRICNKIAAADIPDKDRILEALAFRSRPTVAG